MATVFMKWLERRPETYDRGIQILTLGRLTGLWKKLTSKYVNEGDRVLELGCGTGALTRKLAEAGAKVIAIDVAPGMLEVAMDRIGTTILTDNVQFKRMDVTQIGSQFSERTFDLIVTSLMLSELSPEARDLVLHDCVRLLAPEGRLVILDELVPSGFFKAFIYYFLRLPLSLLTWLLTKTKTHPIKKLHAILATQGYQLESSSSSLGGSLCLISAIPSSRAIDLGKVPSSTKLQHRVTAKTILLDLWALFFRILPPYPKQKAGLYSLGRPGREACVVVTGNYELTVRRVVKALDGKLDAWLLVVDSAGINVWCAAGGGFLTADKVMTAIKLSHLNKRVNHQDLILPQLAAVGVDGNQIQEESGWNVRWGPAKAEDLPEYVKTKFQKTARMRLVRFPLFDRLEMVSSTLGMYGLMILIPIAIFWRHLLIPTAIVMIALSYFYALFLPWLPGRDGLAKAIPLTALSILGVVVFSFLCGPVPMEELFNRVMGVSALSIFIAGEFQGMSPLMRGEQANWIPEAAVGTSLGLIYWFLPKLLGWR